MVHLLLYAVQCSMCGHVLYVCVGVLCVSVCVCVCVCVCVVMGLEERLRLSGYFEVIQ